MIHFFMLLNRQGKLRLAKYYDTRTQKERSRIQRELTTQILQRTERLSNVIEYLEYKVIYRKYASLYFVACVDKDDNELLTLELVHLFVVCLDKYFGNVCELDLVFNFDKVYQILDEFIANGEVVETSKESIVKHVEMQDAMERAEAMQNGLVGLWD